MEDIVTVHLFMLDGLAPDGSFGAGAEKKNEQHTEGVLPIIIETLFEPVFCGSWPGTGPGQKPKRHGIF